MIKRFRFVKRQSGTSVQDFAAAWPETVARMHSRAALRVVACTTLHDVEAAPHDGLSIEWFAELDALCAPPRDGMSDAEAIVICEERVLRGADWLAQRWSQGVKLKHMALARRANALSAAEFSERWRMHAGNVGSTPIPEAAKGFAYVQNYPPQGVEARACYDAINEVYFDDLDAMRSRIEFFRSLDARSVQSDLVGEATFIAVREHVVF